MGEARRQWISHFRAAGTSGEGSRRHAAKRTCGAPKECRPLYTQWYQTKNSLDTGARTLISWIYPLLPDWKNIRARSTLEWTRCRFGSIQQLRPASASNHCGLRRFMSNTTMFPVSWTFSLTIEKASIFQRQGRYALHHF